MSGFPGAYIKGKSNSNLCSTSGQKLLTRKSNPFTVDILGKKTTWHILCTVNYKVKVWKRKYFQHKSIHIWCWTAHAREMTHWCTQPFITFLSGFIVSLFRSNHGYNNKYLSVKHTSSLFSNYCKFLVWTEANPSGMVMYNVVTGSLVRPIMYNTLTLH